MGKQLYHFYEETGLMDSVKGIAKRRGTSYSAIVREAIRKYLGVLDNELHA